MNNIFFSVIMPAYNAQLFLEEAVRSVIDQSFTSWELIIVNDGSSDDTRKIAERLKQEDKRIRLIDQENQGLTSARKAGVQSANGQWIAFLDADDLWFRHKLELQHDAILKDPGIDVLFSDGYTLPYDVPIKLHYHFEVARGKYSGEEMFRKLFKANCIPVLSACIRAEYKQIINSQNETPGSEDWDYWLTLATEGATFFGMTERLFIYRLHPGSMSAKILDQRLGSAFILIRHFERQKLETETVVGLKKNTMSVYHELLQQGRNSDADNLLRKYQAAFRNKRFDGIGGVISSLHVLRNVKTMSKKMFLTAVQAVLFRPYRKYLKHAHNLKIQYIRWEMGDRLRTNGHFFVSRKGNISAATKDAKLITHGLWIGEYSRVNLAGDAFVYTGCNVRVNSFCNFNIWDGKLVIGNDVLFNNYCSVNCMVNISIGDQTWFGEGVRIYDHNHRYKDNSRPFTEQGMRTGSVTIGDNCWIGSNTVILQNVTIGDNCVIGANNLIYQSIPAGTIVKANAQPSQEYFRG